LPGVAVTAVGAPGAVPGITWLEGPAARASTAIDITTMQARTANNEKYGAFAFFFMVQLPKGL
jgi:hypothetical protein